ncbi:MAG TPA: hypothetical protein DCX06_11100 [Opitutae bacterium]|nr:hypothetical protein [Opitutae bacterium]
MDNEAFAQAIRLAKSASTEVGHVNFLMNRPAEGVHVPVEELYLDVEKGIIGDRWLETAWLKLPDGSPDPRVQVSLTNVNVMRCFTGLEGEGVYRCGDNVYTDLNLCEQHLQVGAQLKIGAAIIEVSDVKNDACGKFSQRFGKEAFAVVRETEFSGLRLRGVFARILQSGKVVVHDSIMVL